MRYEAAAVIRDVEIEIKEYFAIFSEDNALNIMEVVDGAVSAICVMLGLCKVGYWDVGGVHDGRVGGV